MFSCFGAEGFCGRLAAIEERWPEAGQDCGEVLAESPPAGVMKNQWASHLALQCLCLPGPAEALLSE